MDKVLSLLATFVILIADNANALAGYKPQATVEAEYGDELVEGEVVTLAHHGPRSGNTCPCIARVDPLNEGATVGLSHFDLDTLGGVMRLAGYQPWGDVAHSFWQIAAKVDVRGPHRLDALKAREAEYLAQAQGIYINDARLIVDKAERCLHAFWAWSQSNKLFPPRDGSADNCTKFLFGAAETVQKILDGDEELLKAGDAFKAAEDDLNSSSFVKDIETRSGHVVVVRRASAFTNHLYNTPSGEGGQVVVALRDDFHSITVSRSGDDVPLDCCQFVQTLWGEKAGGHAGIAGSPRGVEYDEADLDEAVESVCVFLDMVDATS